MTDEFDYKLTDGEWTATPRMPEDPFQAKVPIEVRKGDRVVFTKTWEPSLNAERADLAVALAMAILEAKQAEARRS